MTTILIHDIGELATMANGPRAGAEAMNDVGILHQAGIVAVNGIIREVGSSSELRKSWTGRADIRIHAQGRAVVPGFVDAHTHALFASDRAHELEMRLRGVPYKDILKQGGGILYTVERTREATRAELLKALYRHFDAMLDQGTTTVEVKTGYGLNEETEARMLAILEEMARQHPMDVVPTLMPAHAVPSDEPDTDAYVARCVEWVRKLAKDAEFVDVFCEEGVFDVDQSREILEAGREVGLGVKVHAEELAHSGGAALAAEMQAASADHLLRATPRDRELLREAGVVPVLLPGTAFSLGATYADAKAFMTEGHPVAIASDFNPNCYAPGMPFAITLACYGMGMTASQALAAATINAAKAVERDDLVGSIEEGKQADLVILDAPSHTYIPYRIGWNPVHKVVKAGEVVVERAR
ncbi:MAG: imidazolonepropionase [Thermoplasmatota archaeon]